MCRIESCLPFLLVLLLAGPAWAQRPQAVADEPPVLLLADRMQFNDQTGVAIASGKVEISQGERVLLADTVTYDREGDIVLAEGGVALLEPDGTVIFTDRTELTSDFGNGVADQVRVLMPDNARVTGTTSERIDNRYTILHQTTYSPCDLCAKNPEAAPLWQVRARKAVHDDVAQDVIYRDAWLQFSGVPVIYTPYLSHPAPDVFQRSGFLSPRFGNTDALGFFAETPYYVALDEYQDLTLSPTFSEQDKLKMQGEYRRRFRHGKMRAEASGTVAERVNESGIIKHDQFRGHFEGEADFDLGKVWRTGGNLQLVTDKTYPLRYPVGLPDILKTRAYVEGFAGRDYAGVDALGFQDTRPGRRAEEPLVLPRLRYSALGAPGKTAGGRWSLDSGLLTIDRATEGDVRRLHAQSGWQRRDVSRLGTVSTISASLLTSAYWVEDLPNARAPGTKIRNDTAMRVFPQLQGHVAYPFVRNWEGSQTLITPEASVIIAPGVRNDSRIPNEDSADLEFGASNLFSANRFPGIDRIDAGSRVVGGVRAGHYAGAREAELFLGQSYQFLGGLGDAPAGSGLERRQSDIVGAVRLVPASWLDAHYDFRLDSESLAPRRHDVDASAGVPWFRPYTGYLFLQSAIDPFTGLRPTQEQILFGATSRLSEFWSLNVWRRLAIQPVRGPLNTNLSLDYTDECFNFRFGASRDETKRPGLNSGTSVFFQIVFKSLGGIQSAPVIFAQPKGYY